MGFANELTDQSEVKIVLILGERLITERLASFDENLFATDLFVLFAKKDLSKKWILPLIPISDNSLSTMLFSA